MFCQRIWLFVIWTQIVWARQSHDGNLQRMLLKLIKIPLFPKGQGTCSMKASQHDSNNQDMMFFGMEVTTELQFIVICSYQLWHKAKKHVFPRYDKWPCVTFKGLRQWFSMASLLLPLPPLHFFSHPLPPRFHNDGRMLDVFQRLTAKEGTYFLPQDLELSNQELSYIVKKAEQWRGFNGERRKVGRPPWALFLSLWTLVFSSNPWWLIGLMAIFLTRDWAKRSLILIY